jgi:alpha-methylacyl-CoA racemase
VSQQTPGDRQPGALPLAGVRVLDFSTLLPGPLASLILRRAGANVIKVERPAGDEMRRFHPQVDGVGIAYQLLNEGKRVLRADLKDEASLEHVLALAARADVVIEQFRPGVAERLGIGFHALHNLNPGLIYCSITGYGQTGPDRGMAGHDLTYLAEGGFLSAVADGAGNPVLPPVLTADIGAGAFPAVINILLALRGRRPGDEGCHLDVPMAGNLQTFALNELSAFIGTGSWPTTGAGVVHGSSPRYHLYRTADGRHLAAAPMEQHFWETFCDLIGLPADLWDDTDREQQVIEAVSEIISNHTAEHWRNALAGADTACAVVASFEEAYARRQRTSDLRLAEAASLHIPVDEALTAPVGPLDEVPLDVDWEPDHGTVGG